METPWTGTFEASPSVTRDSQELFMLWIKSKQQPRMGKGKRFCNFSFCLEKGRGRYRKCRVDIEDQRTEQRDKSLRKGETKAEQVGIGTEKERNIPRVTWGHIRLRPPYLNTFFSVIYKKTSLCSPTFRVVIKPGWPTIQDAPASASQMPKLQACATTLSLYILTLMVALAEL